LRRQKDYLGSHDGENTEVPTHKWECHIIMGTESVSSAVVFANGDFSGLPI